MGLPWASKRLDGLELCMLRAPSPQWSVKRNGHVKQSNRFTFGVPAIYQLAYPQDQIDKLDVPAAGCNSPGD